MVFRDHEMGDVEIAVSFRVPDLRPGEIYRGRCQVSSEIPYLSWRTSYLNLTDQRLILSCARVGNIFVLPLFPITFFTFVFHGFAAAIIPGAAFLCLMYGFPLKTKDAFNLSDIASCTYRKAGDFFGKDSVTIAGKDGASWRLCDGARRQQDSVDVVELLGKAGLTVIGIPERKGWLQF